VKHASLDIVSDLALLPKWKIVKTETLHCCCMGFSILFASLTSAVCIITYSRWDEHWKPPRSKLRPLPLMRALAKC